MLGASLDVENILLKQPETRLLSLCHTKVKSHVDFRTFIKKKKKVLESKLDLIIDHLLSALLFVLSALTCAVPLRSCIIES